jgi:hypothetical protein
VIIFPKRQLKQIVFNRHPVNMQSRSQATAASAASQRGFKTKVFSLEITATSFEELRRDS